MENELNKLSTEALKKIVRGFEFARKNDSLSKEERGNFFALENIASDIITTRMVSGE